jgi:hypothetical protein
MKPPILQLATQGNAWVAVFFILLGYVNSLKDTQQPGARQTDATFGPLSSSTFRRTGPLAFSTATVTTLAWFACELAL